MINYLFYKYIVIFMLIYLNINGKLSIYKYIVTYMVNYLFFKLELL